MQYLCTHMLEIISTHPLWNQLERQLIAKPCYGIRHQFIRVLIAILLNTYNYTIYGIRVHCGRWRHSRARSGNSFRPHKNRVIYQGYTTHTMRDYGRNMCPQNYFRSDRIIYFKFIPRGKKGHIYPAILAIATTVSSI